MFHRQPPLLALNMPLCGVLLPLLSCFIKHFLFIIIIKKTKPSEKCCLALTHSPWLPEEQCWNPTPTLSPLIKLQKKHTVNFSKGEKKSLFFGWFFFSPSLPAMKIAKPRCQPL